jgi:hypothetical protein
VGATAERESKAGDAKGDSKASGSGGASAGSSSERKHASPATVWSEYEVGPAADELLQAEVSIVVASSASVLTSLFRVLFAFSFAWRGVCCPLLLLLARQCISYCPCH